MKTKKQQELIDSFLDTLDSDLRSAYREIVQCLDELGYYPRKQRSYLVFKHDLHHREMAKMGATRAKDAVPYFALRFSACKEYSPRFAKVIKDYIDGHPGKLFPHCENGKCVFREDGDRTPFYEYHSSCGETEACCGSKALVIPNITAEDIEEIKKLIREEHHYLLQNL